MTSEQFYLIENYIMSLKLPTDPLFSRIINVQIKLAINNETTTCEHISGSA